MNIAIVQILETAVILWHFYFSEIQGVQGIPGVSGIPGLMKFPGLPRIPGVHRIFLDPGTSREYRESIVENPGSTGNPGIFLDLGISREYRESRD